MMVNYGMELIMGINGINHGLSKITQITVGNSTD